MFARFGPRATALVYQTALVVVVCVALWYLASTAADNLRRLGIASGFGFLFRESGFAIGETTLIAHSAADTYLRALLAGLFNTFRVAVLAIFFSTAVGVLLSLARLSSNWLAAKLAAAYVEIFRNTPLIVQLFFWYAALTENLPGPAEAWNPLPGVFLSNRGLALPWPGGAGAAWLAFASVLILGSVAFGVTRLARRSTFDRAGSSRRAIVALIIAALWGVSLALIDVEHPQLTGFDFAGGAALSPEFTALLLGLSLYTAAFIGEIIRAGFLAVERGQIEAGVALGLSQRQVLRFIVAPQALRLVVPPTTSQYLNCVKNSSLAVAIGYPDLVSIANTTINQTGQAIEGLLIIMLVYLTISLAIAALMNWYNRRVALRGAAP
jgi:general L-amino acid transport system permease protein